MADTKHQWKTIVTADDLDAHMTAIGQVHANAEIVDQLMGRVRFPERAKIYVPGCGTGQLFEFIDSNKLLPYRFFFTDINEEFVTVVKNRFTDRLKFRTAIDDLEESKITEQFDAAILVLVLEHVDWRKALTNVIACSPRDLFIILQIQEKQSEQMVAANRELRPSIKLFRETARPELLDLSALTAFLSMWKYTKAAEIKKEVPDGKAMLGLLFTRSQ